MKINLNADLKWLLIGAVVFAGAVVFITNFNKDISDGPDETYQKAPTETADTPRRDIPVEKVRVLDKRAVEKKVDLPEEVRADSTKHVIATGVIPPYAGKTDIQAVFAEQTGETEIYSKRRPLPFFEWKPEYELDLRYGLSTSRGQEAGIAGRFRPIHIRVSQDSTSRLGLGLYGEVNTEPEAKIMLELSFSP